MFKDLFIFFGFFSKLKIIRRLILISADLISLYIALLVSTWFLNIDNHLISFYLFTFPLTILLFIFTGQYKGLSRYVISKDLYKIVARNFIILIYQLIIFRELNLFKFFILNFFIFSSLIGFMRFSFRDLIKKFYLKKNINKSELVNRRALIYGAGDAGSQLAASLELDNKYKICGFIDDDSSLYGRELSGYSIFNPKEVGRLIEQYSINEILIAIPSISKGMKSSIIKKFSSYGIKVLKIPTLDEIKKGTKNIGYLQEIEIEDLLQRESVPPNKKLIEKVVQKNNIFVTGAGGSIGTELCKQILKYNPKNIILLERSEFNLYQIQMKLKNQFSEYKNKIFYYLGSASDELLLEKIFAKHSIDIIFHAAAFKHVPLLEVNPLEAIKNNILTTNLLCILSNKFKVKHMLMISTDKAVRPTNVMGATKRVAEMLVQGYAKQSILKLDNKNKNLNNTSFSIVRFGNVLGSSGSVVPQFQDQIKSGGPVTLTHKDVIRYFMSINEAVELVLQASGMETDGNILLLDMGQPVKIYDMAIQMIALNGLTVKDDNNQSGDIEIVTIGLRPGEKLYEELLIDKNSQSTSHPLIFKGIESSPDLSEVLLKLNILKEELENYNEKKCLEVLSSLVPEWSKL